MSIKLSIPGGNDTNNLKPRITVIGVGGAGGNAVNNMISSVLEGVDFVVANTDAQALAQSRAERRIQMGSGTTQGLGAGARPEIGRAAAEESIDEILEQIKGSNMVFIAAGMGGGTGTGAAPVIAKTAREHGILTIGVITKPFHFEGAKRMTIAEGGVREMGQFVDTLIVIPNQNLFRVANEKTTFADAFKMADGVLYSGVRGVTDLMVMPGLINLDFADIRSVMGDMGKAMMGTGEADGERRALDAAEAAISNPLLDDTTMKGAKGVLINITGGSDMTLFEVDEAANRVREEVDVNACITFGSTFDESLAGRMRVSVVATGMDMEAMARPTPVMINLAHAVGKPTASARHEEEQKEIGRAFAPAVAESTVEEPAAMVNEGELPSPMIEVEAVKSADDAEAHIPATPSVGSADPFIPSAPVEPITGINPESIDPFAAAAMANGGPKAGLKAEIKAVKSMGLSLFERVTGTGRAANPSHNVVATLKPPVKVNAPESAADNEGEQKLLGGLDSNDRISTCQVEVDLLDIPAFLRRQAN